MRDNIFLLVFDIFILKEQKLLLKVKGLSDQVECTKQCLFRLQCNVQRVTTKLKKAWSGKYQIKRHYFFYIASVPLN